MQSIWLHAFCLLYSHNKGPLWEGAPAKRVGERAYEKSLPQSACADSSLTEGAFGGCLLLPFHPKNFEFGISIEFILIKFLG